MKFEFNIDAGMKLSREKTLQLLDVAGAMVSSKAIQNVQNNFGRAGGKTDRPTQDGLAGSIFHEVDKSEFKCSIIANKQYAAIQEKGGDIKPKKAKALAIPIHPDAKKALIAENQSIRDVFPDLVLLSPDSAGREHPLLIRPRSRKKQGYNTFDVMYVLVTEVHLKAKPYLVPALLETMPKVLKKVGMN